MLEAADAVNPPGGFNAQAYESAIRNSLNGGFPDSASPLIVPRRTTDESRTITEFARGALDVRREIDRTFDELISQIQAEELPDGFPIAEVLSQLRYLKTEITRSMGSTAQLRYFACFREGTACEQVSVVAVLGAPAQQDRAFAQIASALAQQLRVEQTVQLFSSAGAMADAVQVHIFWKTGDTSDKVELLQQVFTLAGIITEPYTKTFEVDPEQAFYSMPQEMVLALPGELSTLWMVADDTDAYLRFLLAPVETPIPPPSQGRIAFVSNRDGNAEIYVMAVDGSQVTRLTDSPGEDTAPAWSPDGKRIAFISSRSDCLEIHLMNTDGSEVTQLTTGCLVSAGPIAWAPGGQRLAFTSNGDGNAEVYIISVDGSGLTNLTNNPAQDLWPAWGAGGQAGQERISFASNRDGDWENYVM